MAILFGSVPFTTDYLFEFLNDVKFIVVVSIITNHCINMSVWKKNMGLVWSVIMLEYHI